MDAFAWVVFTGSMTFGVFIVYSISYIKRHNLDTWPKFFKHFLK